MFLMNLLLASDTNGQKAVSVKKVDISILQENPNVKELFESVEKLTDYAIHYDEGELGGKLNKSVFLASKDMKVSDLLIEISKQVGVKFRQIDGDISVANLEKNGVSNEQALFIRVVEEDTEVFGRVTDENGQGLLGVNVFIKNTTIGTISDIEGNFKIQAPVGSFLTISYIGYLTQEIMVSDQAVINVRLVEDAAQLAEVVVIGYGTQSEKKFTGSVGVANVDELNKIPSSNFDQALVGKIPGVLVTQTSGQPGSELNILIRGTGTLNSENAPLYVVDGIPISGAGQITEFVNMEDIESLSVLKDASSAAIYGSRGSNGVVLITTKRGKLGEKMQISFSHSTSIQQVSKKIDMMDAYQYAQISKDGHDAAYLQEVPTGSADDPNSVRPASYHQIPEELFPYINGEEGLTNTDWQDEIFRDALMQRYAISINGGTDKVSYFVSANHSKQEGIVINSDYQKTSLRANVDVTSGKLKVGVNLSPSFTTENRVNASGPYFEDGIVASALKISPTWSVYKKDGTYNHEPNGAWRIGTDYQHNEILNPVAVANEIQDEVDHYNILGNVFIEYDVLKNLKYRSSVALNYNHYSNEYFRPSSLPTRGRSFYLDPSNPSARISNTYISKWLTENTLTFNEQYSDVHNLTVLAGITAEKSTTTKNRVTNQIDANITTGVNPFLLINTPGLLLESTSEFSQWSLYSWFSRVQYDFDHKYLLSAAMRGDASSRFGPNNRWGYFPSVSVGWRIAEEVFMDNVSWVNELKLSSSYGLTGNNGIGDYEQYSRIEADNYVTGNPGIIQNGAKPKGIANPDLKWETTTMFNAAVNVGLFSDKIEATVEYYDSRTTDILLNVPVPHTTGFGSARQNIGEVSNKGLEASLTVNQKFGDIRWRGNANFAANKNEVISLGPENSDIIVTNGTGHSYFITRVGESIGSYFLLVQDGVFETTAQLDQYPHAGSTVAGDFRFVDIDGDGVIDRDNDRTIVGNSIPDFTYAFSSSLEYKGLELNFVFQGVQGNEILNLQRRYIANGEGNFNNTVELLNRWQSEENPGDGNTNRANRKSRGDNGRTSTWHVEDGSYLRLQNVYLGYNLPASLLSKIKVTSAKIYVSGTNLKTWTNYSGFNPEVSRNAQGALARGLDYGTYPLAKTYTIGINFTF